MWTNQDPDKLGIFLAFLAIAVQNPNRFLMRNSKSEHPVKTPLRLHLDSDRTKFGLGMQHWQKLLPTKFQVNSDWNRWGRVKSSYRSLITFWKVLYKQMKIYLKIHFKSGRNSTSQNVLKSPLKVDEFHPKELILKVWIGTKLVRNSSLWHIP